eukprot:TRINITY_DN36224_c0_g1_i2.p1 TRINITY_DN36224_c0_g1~~TRINITY_DN36224_c0_g1_i2.p1  ORF type:complete len:146 (+),score=23.36 TRINITY_DN36224_c0_g1_i2:189-626(+)
MIAKTLTNQIIYFGSIQIPASQIFYLTKHTYAFVNLKPIVEGHVLVSTRRVVKRLKDLTEIEILELFTTVQTVCKMQESIYQQECAIGIQDGINAGQSIDHIHVHIIPQGKKSIQVLDNDRQVRTQEEMSTEANKYLAYFEKNEF